MGPKPSVVINFTGIEEENYYVTLLSEHDSTGPWSCGDDYYDYLGDESVFKKFSEYDLFVKSENAYERYAFDSYFTADVSDIGDVELSVTIEARICVCIPLCLDGNGGICDRGYHIFQIYR